MRTNSEITEWSECPPGALREFSRRDQRRQVISKIRKWASSAVVVAGLIFGGVYSSWIIADSGRAKQQAPTAWKCSAVIAAMDSYLRNETDEVSRVAIEDHVRRCEHCRQQYEQRASVLEIDFSLAFSVPLPPAEFLLFAKLTASCWSTPSSH